MADTTDAATCSTCGGSGMTNTQGVNAYICRTCGGSGKRSAYVWHSDPAPLPAGSTVTIKPAPDPRVTALVTAARELNTHLAEFLAPAQMECCGTYDGGGPSPPECCGRPNLVLGTTDVTDIEYALVDLTAALEAFKDDQ